MRDEAILKEEEKLKLFRKWNYEPQCVTASTESLRRSSCALLSPGRRALTAEIRIRSFEKFEQLLALSIFGDAD